MAQVLGLIDTTEFSFVTGPQGDPGPRGDPGPEGDPGPQGDPASVNDVPISMNGNVLTGAKAPSGSVSGGLSTAVHSGGVWTTTGNVSIPPTPGFNCALVFGGAHTVSFEGTTSAAMVAGDVMGIVVTSAPAIKAVLTSAANQVAFV